MNKHTNSFGSSQGKVYLPPDMFGGTSKTQMKKDEKKMMEILDNYKSLELPSDKLEGLEEDFTKWINDNSYLGDYSNFQILTEDKVLVRLYRYEAPLSSTLVGADGEKGIMGLKILPYVKVIKAFPGNSQNIKPGDIMCVSELITKFTTNQAWIQWKVIKEEDPSTQIPEPPQITGKLSEWREHVIRKHACRFEPDDNYTFVITNREFKLTYIKWESLYPGK